MTLFIISAIGVAVALVASLLSKQRRKMPTMTHEHVALTIESFLEGKGNSYDWDDFTSVEIGDPYLDSIRKTCNDVHDDYPATEKGHYCNPEGVAVMQTLIQEIRSRTPNTTADRTIQA